MKRYIAVFTAVFLLAAGFPAAAETGTGHWASDMMEDLRQNGVIQGDESGSLNPDSAITRAEFVTVVNRVFQISGTTGENFRDVPPDAWYAEEMLAAKANGYLSGDGVGLAHPEREITRAETCVILARVMKLHTAEESLSFTDGDAIPAWAAGEISALVKGGFVSGYPDGSFQPEKSITRAEAFSILYTYIKSKPEHPAVTSEPTVTPTPAPPSVSISTGSGSSGGGASGSGSSGGVKTLSAPTLKKLAESEDLVSWQETKNASSYEIKLMVGENSKIISGITDTSYRLTDDLGEMTAQSSECEFEVSLWIKAKASKSGYSDSDYSKKVSYKKVYPAIDGPELTLANKIVGGKNRAVVTISPVEDASGYEAKFMVGAQENSTMQYDAENRLLIIPDTSVIGSEDAYVEVKALSGKKPAYKDSAPVRLEIKDVDLRGNGSPESPYRLYSTEDFERVRTEPDRHFVLMADIDLGEIVPVPEFTGSLTSYGERYSLTYVIHQRTSNNVGLFQMMSGSASVSNLILKGQIAGNQTVGALCGKISGNAVVENCISLASVSGNTYVGGFVGEFASSGGMRNCINAGTVTSNNGTGGIAGIASKMIEKCANLGTVVTGGNYAGGIVGVAYGSVSFCYNSGMVKNTSTAAANAARTAGGIAGGVRQGEFKSCFNAGVVDGGSQYAGGITGGHFGNANSTIAITGCYNAGTVTAQAQCDPISSDNFHYTAITVKDTIYLDTMPGRGLGTPISETELKNPENAEVAKLISIYGLAFSDNGYAYPGIEENPFLRPEDLKLWDFELNLNSIFSDGELNFSWDSVFSGEEAVLSVRVIDNSSFLPIAEKTVLDTDAVSFTAQGCRADSYYEIAFTLEYESGITITKSFEVYTGTEL